MFLAIDDEEVLYGGSAGGGKALILASSSNAAILGYNLNNPQQAREFKMKIGSQVLTPFGFKLIDDVAVGDAVCNPDGTTTSVIAVQLPAKQTCYRVTFIDGASVVCGEDHLWSVKKSGKKTRGKVAGVYRDDPHASAEQRFNTELFRRYKTITTIELARLHAEAEVTENRSYWLSVPLSEPANFQLPPGRTAMLPPYILGVWLGDGRCQDCVSWTKPDEFIADEVSRELKATGCGDVVSPRKNNSSYGIIGGAVLNCLRSVSLDGCRSWEKFIPVQYKFSGIENRRRLLQGLMDTDGTVDERGQCSFSTTSPQLRDDVQFLARSLGYSATISEKPEPKFTYNGETKTGRPAWNIYITGRNRKDLFCLPRKKNRVKDINNEGGKRIVSVEKLKGKFETKCISVSNPNGLYLTNDFVVTHNSDALLMAFLQYVDIPHYRGLILRRKGVDLTRSGAILDRAMKWWLPTSRTGVRYEAGKKKFIFPSGATCEFGSALNPGDEVENYQGGAWHYIAFDEATQFESSQYLFFFSRNRRDDELVTDHGFPRVPLRMRCASNPGGPSHNFFRDRFMSRQFAQEFLDRTNAECYSREFATGGGVERRWFVPARVEDNDAVDAVEYSGKLRKLDVLSRQRLLDGNWLINESGVFMPEWFRRYEIIHDNYRMLNEDGTTLKLVTPAECERFVTIDIAGTSKDRMDAKKRGSDPCSTVISVWDYTPDGWLIWRDVIRLQGEFPAVVDAIRNVYHRDKPQAIWVEVDGIGRPYYQQLVSERLPAYALESGGKDKLTRAAPVTLEAREGRVWLPSYAPWLDVCESELWAWQGTSGEQTDQIDTLAYAGLLKVNGRLGGVIRLQ